MSILVPYPRGFAFDTDVIQPVSRASPDHPARL